jgi:Cdc6-like AAA superfamily ATPase
LFSYSNTPIILTGQPGSGKKAILDLFAKNNKNKSQLYSIRFTNKKSLMEMYERPFRKFNSLQGVLLKSVNPNKNVIVSIEDMSLTSKEI